MITYNNHCILSQRSSLVSDKIVLFTKNWGFISCPKKPSFFTKQMVSYNWKSYRASTVMTNHYLHIIPLVFRKIFSPVLHNMIVLQKMEHLFLCKNWSLHFMKNMMPYITRKVFTSIYHETWLLGGLSNPFKNLKQFVTIVWNFIHVKRHCSFR